MKGSQTAVAAAGKLKSKKHAARGDNRLPQCKAGREVKRVDCVEAERIMFIIDQFLAKLLLISGLQAALVSEVRDFPTPVVELKKALIPLKPNREKIQNLTRDALRELLQRPDLCAKLRANNCDNRHRKLNSEVEKLRISMFDRLTMKQSEADDQVLFIRKANQKRVETESQIKKIKEDLANVEQEKNDENEIRSEKIESLKEDIKQIEMQCQQNCSNIRAVAEQQKIRYCADSQKVQNKIKDDITPLEIEWRKLIVKHREDELVLRGKKFRMQNELDNWLNKYDDFMETQNGKIAEIQAEYDTEKADMTDLQEKFIKLKEEYDAIMHERQLIREEKERIQKEFEDKTFAAQIIQAFFRGYMFVKYAKTDGKRPGKKGKKDKGKDKKKK